jgi:hypothetical protein
VVRRSQRRTSACIGGIQSSAGLISLIGRLKVIEVSAAKSGIAIAGFLSDRRTGLNSMPQNPRRALRRGRCAIIWENTVIGTTQVRYFVQGLGNRKFDSTDFPTLPDAERYFEVMEASPR